jgi:hypothetical protein
LAGVQMVTEGEAVFRVHWAAEVPASSSTIPVRAAVSSNGLDIAELFRADLLNSIVHPDGEIRGESGNQFPLMVARPGRWPEPREKSRCSEQS